MRKIRYMVLVVSLIMIGLLFSLPSRKNGFIENTPFFPESSVIHETIDIDGNVALDTFISDSTDGLSWSTAHIIENLEIDTNGAPGIRLFNIDRFLIIRNCTITNEDNPIADGIRLSGCTNLKIINCRLSGHLNGVYFTDSQYILVENCTSIDNINGIALRRCTYNNISNNIVTENNHDGIILIQDPCSHNLVFNNSLIANSQYGISLEAGANNNEVFFNCFRDNELGEIQNNGVSNNIHDNFECPTTTGGSITPEIPGYPLIVILTSVSCTIIMLTYVNIKKREK